MKRFWPCFFLFGLIFVLFSIGYTNAQPETAFTFRQNVDGQVLGTTVTPFAGDVSAQNFYDYGNDSSNTNLEKSNCALIIPYRDPKGNLSLIMILDRPGDGSGGSASLTIKGLPSSATLALRDDPDDYRDDYLFEPPRAEFSWNWSGQNGDGAIIGNLEEVDSLELIPNFASGIDRWEVVTGTPENPKRMGFNTSLPLTLDLSINDPPVAELTVEEDKFYPRRPIKFDASDSQDPDGSIEEYQWDFNGDGEYSVTTEKPVVEHTYEESGDYEVSLSVVDDSGSYDTVNQGITVKAVYAEVERQLSSLHATPGTVISATLKIRSFGELAGLGIEENLPEGWELRPVSNAGAAFKEGESQWVFTSTLDPNEEREIEYEILVPPRDSLVESLPLDLELTGSATAPEPSFEQPVEGDDSLRIDEVLPPAVAVAHYDLDQEQIDLRMDDFLTRRQLHWAAKLWRAAEILPGTGGDGLTYEAMKELSLRYLTETRAGDEVESRSAPELELHSQIFSHLPSNTVLLNNGGDDDSALYDGVINALTKIKSPERELNGVGIEIEVPKGWELTPVEDGEAVYKPSTNQWVFLSSIPAGESRRLSYKLRVPPEQSEGTYRLRPTFSEAWSGHRAVFGEDNPINLTRTLSNEVIISRWSLEENRLDLTLGNSITYDQVKRALIFWLEDEPLPHSGDRLLEFSDVQRIITYWLEDVPVTRSLESPEAP
ncbi:MAG: PKD domain-containing protein [Candidatus Bipolaricaulota bacterium]